MSKINNSILFQLLALAGVSNARLTLGVKCFDPENPEGEKSHISRNAWGWEAGERTGYITREGLVCETWVSDMGNIYRQEILPFAGSFESSCHRIFRAAHYPNAGGIRA